MKNKWQKVLLKCKNKRNVCVCFTPYMEFLVFEKRFIFLQEDTKRQVPILVIMLQDGMLTIPHGLRQFWQHCHVILKKKLFLSGIIVSVTRRRKDITVTFVSSGFHAGRFTVECTEYDDEYDMMNMIWMYRKLFSYYDIFMYLSSNFTLDLRLWIHRLAASHLLY